MKKLKVQNAHTAEELKFLKLLDENFCNGAILFGTDQEQAQAHTSIAALISTRIAELEMNEQMRDRMEEQIEKMTAEGINFEALK